jgi:hypothetical protein
VVFFQGMYFYKVSLRFVCMPMYVCIYIYIYIYIYTYIGTHICIPLSKVLKAIKRPCSSRMCMCICMYAYQHISFFITFMYLDANQQKPLILYTLAYKHDYVKICMFAHISQTKTHHTLLDTYIHTHIHVNLSLL